LEIYNSISHEIKILEYLEIIVGNFEIALKLGKTKNQANETCLI
jgi:hypothetical protein